jgi:hypothetical protein
MSWSHIQSALENVFVSATGLPFVWEDEPRKLLPRPFGILALGQSSTVGRDHSSYTFHDSDISLELHGYRELTISVQIISRQARGEQSSRALIERARLALANPVYRDELRSAGLVFVENHPVLDISTSFDQRKEARAAFDVVFRLMVKEHHAWPQGGFFESVEVSENLL